eukprot:CAMPEP_0174892838 /NCGR_PEP_ID=MMETSP0167-20121228/7733_1 /TAXON_ID=38298 /ORGANISM="Rhodella maculata, Strain CCMP736" /LENGTH=41 /DNA_ID= /DNA_START= /DNA_END= /DNA_ORIENTATION=
MTRAWSWRGVDERGGEGDSEAGGAGGKEEEAAAAGLEALRV